MTQPRLGRRDKAIRELGAPPAGEFTHGQICLEIPGQPQPARRDVVRPWQKKERRKKRLGLDFSWIDNLGDGEDLNGGLFILRCLRMRVGENAVGRTQIDPDDVLGILQDLSP
jgi:hypothetical protein